MIRFLLKEASLLLAFVVLGSLLLVSIWVTTNVHRSIVSEFKNAQISVVVKEGEEVGFRKFLEENKKVLRFEFYSAEKNKERLGGLYPELKNLVDPLEVKFFPTSAVISVDDGAQFLKELEAQSTVIDSQLLHEPPYDLSRFLGILTSIFLTLWLLTLTLVLYFNVERLTLQQLPRWSLMKMLGAKPSTLFLPLWGGQMVRVTLASLSALVLAWIAFRQIQSLFVWNWTGLSPLILGGFVLAALVLASVISLVLFYGRYSRVAIG